MRHTVVGLLALSLLARPAGASPAPTPGGTAGASAPRTAGTPGAKQPDLKLEAAKRLDKKANVAFEGKQYVEAANLWLMAYQQIPRPDLLFNVALAYEKHKDYVRAVRHLRDFLRLALGNHEFVNRKGSVELIAQGKLQLKKLLQRVAILTVKGEAGATVFIDGRPVGKVPVIKRVLSPGAHHVRLLKGATVIGEQHTTLAAGGSETVMITGAGPAKPVPKRKLSKAYMLTFAVVAVALAGGAIGTGVKALQLNREFKDTSSASTRRNGVALQTATNVLWGVAGAAAVTSAILAVFTQWTSKPSARERSAHVELRVTPITGGAAATVWGRF